MAFINRAQFGYKAQASWGTAVTVNKFLDYIAPDGIQTRMGYIEQQGVRAGGRVRGHTRYARYADGAGGDVSFEVQSKGFGGLFMLANGTVTTAGPTDSAYTHTAKIDTLMGASKAFTMQLNRPFQAGDTNQAFTYGSCKIMSYRLENSVPNLLMFTPTIECRDVTTATSLASASYASGTVEPFTFAGASVTIGGTAYCPETFNLQVNNNLSNDTRRLCSSGLRGEFYEAGYREIILELGGGDFNDLSLYNLFTASGPNTLQAVASWTAATLIGTATYPSVTVTVDEAAVWEHTIGTGMDRVSQVVRFHGLFDGTNAPLSIAYVSADTSADPAA